MDTFDARPPIEPIEPIAAPPAPVPRLAPVLAGLGLTAIIYDLTALGFGQTSTEGMVLLGLGVGALVGSHRLSPKKPPAAARVRVLLLMLVGMVLGFGVSAAIATPPAFARLHVHELPGLSVSLPGGTEKGKTGDYDNGSLLVGPVNGFPAAIGLAWQPGGLPDDELARMITGVLAKMLDATVDSDVAGFAPSGLPSRSYAVHKDGTPGFMTMFACGRRNFTVFTLSRGARRLHERVLASVKCHPDAAKEAVAAEPPPVAIDLPTGWTQKAGDGTQLTYEAEGRELDFMRLPAEVDVAKFLTELAKQVGGTDAKVAPLPGEAGRTLWSLEVAGESPVHGRVVKWSCGDQAFLGIFITADAAQLADGKALLLAARCK